MLLAHVVFRDASRTQVVRNKSYRSSPVRGDLERQATTRPTGLLTGEVVDAIILDRLPELAYRRRGPFRSAGAFGGMGNNRS